MLTSSNACPFAIKGAGHAPQAGAANIVSCIPFPALIDYVHESQVNFNNNRPQFVFRLGHVSRNMNADAESFQQSGVTIDMTGLASVTVNEDKTVASVGAAATWLDVYLYLDGLGVAVAGGRNAAVGVGGLTLGGQSFHRN